MGALNNLIQSNLVSEHLFFLSGILISAHMFFGLFWLTAKSQKTNYWIFVFTALSTACLYFLFQNVDDPKRWFLFLVLALLGAIGVHINYKKLVSSQYLKEYINYKMYIEIYSILLGLLGAILSVIFQTKNGITALSVFTLIYLMRLNWLIFIRKNLYSIKYKVPVVSEHPFISVVIIAYNEEKYIGKLLECLKNQDYKNFEVIFVDDHSTDRTVSIVNCYSNYFPLKIVQKEIKGAARSRNYGASFARGELVLFLDADVLIAKDFLSKNLKVFSKLELSVAFIDFKPLTKNSFDIFAAQVYRIWLKIVQYFNPRGIGSCILIKKEIHDQVLFDETFAMQEDFDYIERAAKCGKFRIITAKPYLVSWRRFDEENSLFLILKYFIMEFQRISTGKVKRLYLPYNFGGHRKK